MFFSKKIDQTRIIESQKEGVCLDSVQLELLEQEFRTWADASKRSDVRLARKRILLIFLLIRNTGAKLNEVLSLNPCLHVDPCQNVVVINAQLEKGCGARREVPISDRLSKEVVAMLSDPEFREVVCNKFAVDSAFVRRKFYERTVSCGFEKKLGAPELIRQARAVELLQGNMPLPAVQNILGHSSAGQTETLVSFSKVEINRLARLHMEKETDRKTSARNSFFGKVDTVISGGIFSVVKLTTIDGFSLFASITKGSFDQLGIKKGRLISAEVKAPTVTMLKAGKDEPICSAENLFKGVISRIEVDGLIAECVVQISKVTELCTIITNDSKQQLDVSIGDEAWVMFNSFSVVLHVD